MTRCAGTGRADVARTEAEVYIEWAHRNWPALGPITKVEFELGSHGPYSEVTPNVDEYVRVYLTLLSGRVIEKEVMEVHQLIRDLVGIANGG